MPPTVKGAENLTAKTEGAARAATNSALPGDSAIKQQPVALEVPVTVNGACTHEGSEKREPFSESTKTVLIFGNGAVIRLSSAVAPGQLLFLTNEKTKKEVVCQVVKSKNYRNVSGYVELEFTESVVGFWGMRFPSDRIASAPQQTAHASVIETSLPASGSPAIPRPAAPAVVAPKPAVPIPVAEAKTVAPTARKEEEPVVQKPVAPVARLSSTLSSSFDPEAPLAVRSTPPPAPVVPTVPAVPVSAAPDPSMNPALVPPIAPAPVLSDSPRAEVQASILEPAKTAGVPLAPTVQNLLSLFEAKPAAPVAEPEPAVQVFADPETETLKQTLKQHTARLEQELSNMKFSGESAKTETASVRVPHVPPVVKQKEPEDDSPKVLEHSKIHATERTPAAPLKPARLAAKSSLDGEELKIPAWLEPLARNAAAPSSTQELIEKERAKRLAEQPKVEEIVPETATIVEETRVPRLPLPTFGSGLPLEEKMSARASGSRKSGSGMLIGALAAGFLLLAGGGWWYMQQQSSGAPAGSEQASASRVQASVASLPVASSPAQPQGNAIAKANPPAPSDPPALTNTSVKSNPNQNSLSVVPAAPPASAARTSQPISNRAKVSAAVPAPVSAQPPAEQPKKPVLGEVHLAKPKVLSGRHAQTVGEPDADISLNSDDQPAAEGLNAGLAVPNNQPSAPAALLAVGGDVKQAKLLSSVPPVYPMLAKNQRVSGNVMIDALIDANGRVTTMKVVSGPTLLQQAAMDALKQWKYQPASLDGKPVSMHLTVTIQFRLQQ